MAGTKDQWFHIPEESEKKAVFRYQVRLPPYLTCTQCVLRWSYYTGIPQNFFWNIFSSIFFPIGNMWGICANGTEAQGCGKSEQFKNCADVSIVSSTGGAVPPLFIEEANPFLLYYKDLRMLEPYNVHPLIVRDQVCVPTKSYRIIPGMDSWCETNCLSYPPNCPSSLCYCP